MAIQKTRNDIVNYALTLVGAKAAEDAATSADLLIASQALDDMVKDFQATGPHLWSELSATLFTQPGQREYLLGPGTTDHATEEFTETTTTASSDSIVTTDTFVAVSSTGTGDRVMTSTDGITWTSQVSAADNFWTSVAYGNGLFVAVAASGTGDRVMTSPDGITWTLRASAVDNNWNGVTFGNNIFVAVSGTGTGDRVMTSDDGITWTARASAADDTWQSVAYGNGTFVAVSTSGGTNRVMTSPDGVVWTLQTSAASNLWTDVTFANGLFVAVSSSGTGDRVMTSEDGVTWTSRASAADNNWQAITYANGQFVAVAGTGTGDRVMTSPDGINWSIQGSAADNSWTGVAFNRTIFAAVSSTGTGDRVMTSPDGETWTSRASASDNDWQDIAVDTTQIPVSSTAGISVGYNVGIENTSNSLSWGTITAFTATTITVDFDVEFNEGAFVYFYATDLGKPLRIPDARRFTVGATGQEIELLQSSRIDYLRLPVKTTSGTPTQFYYQPLENNGNIFIWPVPIDVNSRINFTYYKPLDIFDDADDAADFPNEWIAALKYNLAVRIAPLYDMVLRQEVIIQAERSLTNALTWDQGDESVYFTFSEQRRGS